MKVPTYTLVHMPPEEIEEMVRKVVKESHQQPIAVDSIVTLKQAADYLGCCVTTVRKIRKEMKLSVIRNSDLLKMQAYYVPHKKRNSKKR